MAIMRILTRAGDTAVEWDEKQAEAGDEEAVAAVKEAERIFEEQKAKGATAFKLEPGMPAKKLERFDPQVHETVVVPRIAGGQK